MRLPVVTFAALAAISGASHAQSIDLRTILDPSRVCSLSRDLLVGLDSAEPAEMIEVVRPVSRDGRAGWRAIHYPLRIVEIAREGAGTFDMTDVEAATLRPIESEARHGADPVRFDYAAPAARQLGPKGEVLDTTAFGDRVPLPWYPGAAILTQAIPWRDGLRAHGYIVDNYTGRGDARLRRVDVEVVGRETVAVGGATFAAYRVNWRAEGGFALTERVSVARPHQILQTDYYPVPGGKPFRSRLVAMANGGDCRT